MAVGLLARRILGRELANRELLSADRVAVHRRYWEELAQRPGRLLYVAVGDSTAQGIGAGHPSGSYVGRLERLLPGPLRVINLSVTGARLSDLHSAVVPQLRALELDDALVTVTAGIADLDGFAPERFSADAARLLDALPGHALVSDLPALPFTPVGRHVPAANAILRDLADARDLAVVPLYAATRRLAHLRALTHRSADLLHPNDLGYRTWARAMVGPARARLDAVGNRPSV
ncbi:MAG TPA: SGNH/GDSL hydrolase family protein [Solirubrobacteraceae bacterium]|nr:SGNH/GDSL hydrolase family protein [Solirubrobacteraceae bacterium]